MSFIRKIKQRGKTYYAEVENLWINGKCIQKHIRSLGTDPEHPTNFQLNPIHFSYLAVRLMQGDLTPNEVFELLENMGQPIRRETLERIGIFYDFDKKNYNIYLFYPKKRSKKSQHDAKSAEKNHTQPKRMKE